MKKFTLILTAIVFIALLEINAQSDSESSIAFEQSGWTEIVQKAKAGNKIIFLDAYASWCGPCKHMAKNIFTNEDVAEFYNNNFINAKIDMEKGEGIEIAKQYNVKNYPTFLFIDGDGNVMHQACGGRDATGFIKVGELAFEDHMNTSAYLKKFETSELSASFMTEYISVLSEACINTEGPLNKYFNNLSGEQYKEAENINLFLDHVLDYNNPVFKILIKEQYNFSEIMNPEHVDKKIKDVYSYSIKMVGKANNRTEYDKIQREIKVGNLKEKDLLLLKSDMIWFNYRKNWEEYAAAAIKYTPAYAMDDYRELNSIGWTFYEHVDDQNALSKALEWVKTSLDLKMEYSNMDTYAALLFKLGKKKEAIVAANKAIGLAVEEGKDPEETNALLEKIEALN